ncbi:MAG: VWA domain-containing protein [Bacilli bacterium]|nr:VWA domain-containing protein [Bacilli bacterium]
MTFLYPFALLGLIAIPILIIIYILRSKYKDVTSPTTYIWEVAAKLFKKKNPFSRFEHLLALIVQMMAIAILSIALAHPVFTLKEAADDIVFVLDASSSMNFKNNGETRFEKAKKLIAAKAEEAPNGSTFTLVLAEKSPRIVCQKVNDLSRFQMYLDSVSSIDDTSTLSDAIASAQTLFAKGQGTLCYLASDQNCGEMENIKFLSVIDEEENYAITALSYTHEAKKLKLSGSIVSYASDAELNLQILVNEEEFADLKYNVVKGEPLNFVAEELPFSRDINSVTVNVTNTDGLMADNTYTVYKNDVEVNTKVLVVSSSSTYLRSMFAAMKNVAYTTISPSAYHDNTGYDLYVFDGYSPATLPNDGAVILFGISHTIAGSGFVTSSSAAPTGEGILQLANNDTLLYKELTKDVLGKRDIVISKYQKYSLAGNFTTVMTCDNVPVIFAGRNESGQREVVFAFDLHDSNLPLLFDYVTLMRNFVDYANPHFMNDFDYEIGEQAILTIPDEVTSLTIKTPSGKNEPIHYGSAEAFAYDIKEVGTYTLNATFGDGSVKTVRFYSHSAYKESDPRPEAEGTYGLVLMENMVRADGLFDNILPIVIAAALFFAGDWILYAHEQY